LIEGSSTLSPKSQRHERAKVRRDGLLTTGDMARMSGNTLRTVRFYEEAGLLRPAERTEGGHRLFADAQLKRLELVTDLRAAGFSLEEIREVLEAKQRFASGSEAARDAVRRLDRHLKRMRGRLGLLGRLVRDLEEARRVLARCPHCGRADYAPERCSHCEHLRAAAGEGELPTALRVIWNLEK
jgi:MerR family Zn(II)-responsive transcriptional regulator of zntA